MFDNVKTFGSYKHLQLNILWWAKAATDSLIRLSRLGLQSGRGYIVAPIRMAYGRLILCHDPRVMIRDGLAPVEGHVRAVSSSQAVSSADPLGRLIAILSYRRPRRQPAGATALCI
jgi:hypothetical protein